MYTYVYYIYAHVRYIDVRASDTTRKEQLERVFLHSEKNNNNIE